MNGSWTQTLLKELRSKEFRDAYVAENIKIGIASQIRALREALGWSQSELGQHTGKPQSAISRLEDPDYGRLSLKTLLELASAFDVALLVRFVSFGELVARNKDQSPRALAVPGYTQDDASLSASPSMSIESRPAEPAEVRDERRNVIPLFGIGETGSDAHEYKIEQPAGTSDVRVAANEAA